MNPEQQRIAIAEACGWKGMSPDYMIGYSPDRREPYSDRVNACPIDDLDCIPLDPIPDYLDDLNAIHKAEKFCLTNARLEEEYYFAIDRNPFASASQRAEALLRTLELWEE